ncbi:MAG: hypothetical protein IID63_04140, partial [candidate division Zixibacteria bacterium]|nr:hypothetical protein [candidate division Zixibacteria bacterium]
MKKLNDYDNNFVNKQEVTLSLILKILMDYLKYCILISLAFCPVSGYSQQFGGCNARHNVGQVTLYRGTNPGFGGSNIFRNLDCFTGGLTRVGSCLYPKGSFVTYLDFATAWVGGVVGGDTLVSSYTFLPLYSFTLYDDPFEFHPRDYPYAFMEQRSTLDPSSAEFDGAISEQDFISVSTDTIIEGIVMFPDYFKFRPHIPLGLEFTNSSYAWSLSYAEDIVFFEWTIKNISDKVISDAFIGIEMDVFISYLGRDPANESDDLGGFIGAAISPDGCGFRDNVQIMWSADNDGDPVLGEFVTTPTRDPASGDVVVSCRAVSAVALIDAPIDLIPGQTVSYNWWRFNYIPEFDFGPRHRENFRDFRTGGGLGSPHGDVNQYYIMRNGEIDYDPALITTIKQYDLKWKYPRQDIVLDIADGTYFQQILSVGPIDIAPGNEVPIVFAFVMGENLHTNPRNLENIYDGNIAAYYANLDFSDLIKNAQWARWIYDNPGIDTDNDGYAGEYRVCVFDSVLDANSNWIATVAETTWYKGDGVPDWRAAVPPPAPKMWLTPTFKGINIRFNGQESETTPDIFTKLLDFEGYKIYIARDDRETSYSFIASYDIENYDKYVWNYEKQPFADWEILDFPMTLKQIKCAYALSCDDSLFDVFQYRPSFPYSHPNYPESLFYFVKHEHNVSEFGVTTPITKRFPNAPDPRSKPADSISSDFYTADGYLKFFEYEFIIEDIIPTVAYYVSVTAIDFGWPKSGLEPLETSITENAQQVYAKIVDPAVGADSLQIVVY